MDCVWFWNDDDLYNDNGCSKNMKVFAFWSVDKNGNLNLNARHCDEYVAMFFEIVGENWVLGVHHNHSEQ